MAEQARETTTVNAPLERVFEVLVDFERYPEWVGDLKQAVVVERDDQGRALEVEFRAAAMGRSTTYRLRYDYGGAPRRLSWWLAQGDIERELDGTYVLQPFDGDDSRTELIYELAVDLILPIPGFVKRRAESRIMKAALEDLRLRAEAAS